MATLKKQSFDTGQADGTVITTGNSGDAGDDAFDSVTGSPTYSADHAHSGSLSMKEAPSAGVSWTTAVNTLFGRFYLFIPTGSTVSSELLFAGTSTSLNLYQMSIDIAGGVGTLYTSVNGINDYIFTNKIPFGQWVRIEVKLVHLATTAAPTMETKLFLSPESTTPDEDSGVVTYYTIQAGALITSFRLGTGNSNNTPYYIDDIDLDDATYPGPLPVTVIGAASGGVSATGTAAGSVRAVGAGAQALSGVGLAAGRITVYGSMHSGVIFKGAATNDISYETTISEDGCVVLVTADAPGKSIGVILGNPQGVYPIQNYLGASVVLAVEWVNGSVGPPAVYRHATTTWQEFVDAFNGLVLGGVTYTAELISGDGSTQIGFGVSQSDSLYTDIGFNTDEGPISFNTVVGYAGSRVNFAGLARGDTTIYGSGILAVHVVGLAAGGVDHHPNAPHPWAGVGGLGGDAPHAWQGKAGIT